MAGAGSSVVRPPRRVPIPGPKPGRLTATVTPVPAAARARPAPPAPIIIPASPGAALHVVGVRLAAPCRR